VPAPLLDAAACVRVAKSVARACRFLHHALPAPVVHGDLTVANVLLTDEGVVKLCDFGLSRTQHQVCGGGGRAVRWSGRQFILHTACLCDDTLCIMGVHKHWSLILVL
jgi:serine/threonine protein kinase